MIFTSASNQLGYFESGLAAAWLARFANRGRPRTTTMFRRPAPGPPLAGARQVERVEALRLRSLKAAAS